MTDNLAELRAKARAYGKRCLRENRCVNLAEFCASLGQDRHWLGQSYSNSSPLRRAVAMKEWMRIGVSLSSQTQVPQGADIILRNIPRSAYPSERELSRILAIGGRREMFARLRAEHGTDVAMRYAVVCQRAQGGRNVS